MCRETQIGARWVRTEMPPMTAWTTTPTNRVQDSLFRTARRGCRRRHAMIAAPTATETAKVSIRLVNSTTP